MAHATINTQYDVFHQSIAKHLFYETCVGLYIQSKGDLPLHEENCKANLLPSPFLSILTDPVNRGERFAIA